MDEHMADGLAHIIRERIEEVFGEDAEGGVAWLAEEALGSDTLVDALLAGEPVALGERERAALSEVLSLSPDLLSAVCLPTSPEVARHILAGELSSGDERCPECQELRAALEAHDPGSAELGELLLAALAHVWVSPDPEIEAETARLDEIMRLTSGLSPAGQARVLAACFEEREREARAELSPRDALARFREEFVPAPVRVLIDHLALADESGVAEPELLVACAMADRTDLARALEALSHAGQLFASIHPGYGRLGQMVTLNAGRWRLDPALIGTLRALVRAERHQRRHESR